MTAPVVPPAIMPVSDQLLLSRAQELLERVWVDGRHEVATALRVTTGEIFTGVHLEGSCRRSSICAEGIALGAARSAGIALADVKAVVSVQIKPAGRFRIIAPCGVCRELISDYAPDATVWLTAPGDDSIISMRALDMLPEKSRRTW
ncbi:cytidine/deoxycytidylate deaminase family protein [Catenuloplanes japonicus]|uniref:cytidine deaminase n=1 Tax=Catenuloplanes japonicus TaxID=33876 RepID=UPI000526FAE0|nr:cytidine deaminase [Catenuloplanes japonicus]